MTEARKEQNRASQKAFSELVPMVASSALLTHWMRRAETEAAQRGAGRQSLCASAEPSFETTSRHQRCRIFLSSRYCAFSFTM